MSLLVADIPKALLVCDWWFVDEDGIDAGPEIDIRPVGGSVRIICNGTILRMPNLRSGLVPLTFDGVFNELGQLVPKNGEGIGIWLPACGNAQMSPSDFTYTIEFDLLDPDTNKPIAIKSFSFQIFESEDPAGTDLNDLIPENAVPGTITLQGPPGPPNKLTIGNVTSLAPGSAPTAELVGESPNQTLHLGLASGPQGLPGNATIRVDTTVGKRVFITDGVTEHMISGETGRRRIESLLINGWTGTYLAIGRIGNEVHVFGTGINSTASTSRVAFDIPAGFRNNYFNAAKLPLPGAYSDTAGASPIPMNTIYSTGAFEIVSTTAGSIIFSASWPTADPWPTTLPGIPS